MNIGPDADLKYLVDLRDLRTLRLSGTAIADAGLEHLKGLTELETLTLGGPQGTQITDAGLVHLKGLIGLRTLALTGARITGTGLQQLQGLNEFQNKIVSLTEAMKEDPEIASLAQTYKAKFPAPSTSPSPQ